MQTRYPAFHAEYWVYMLAAFVYRTTLKPTGKRGHAAHIRKMAASENHENDASHYAAAVARWDDEGGAAASFANNTGAKVSKHPTIAN